jgi:phospholipid/cholesterol/gamma-HCH transport system substrate-binding protein
MDLLVGGSILISLFILIAGVLWLKEINLSKEKVNYTVFFPNVGSLQIGDPILANGVKMGTVSDISLQGSRVKVTISVDNNLVITDSAEIRVQNIGLMGERCIGIQLSDKGEVYTPDGGKNDKYLHGYFDSGIAEAMGMLGTVLADVEVLVAQVATIIEQTVGDSSFISAFNTIVARLDSITLVAESLVADNSTAIERSIANIRTVTTDIKSLLDQNSHHVSTVMSNVSDISTQTVSIVAQVESLTIVATDIAKRIEDGEGTVGKMLEDETFYGDLKKTVADLDTLINEVREDALKLRIKLGFSRKKK